MFKRYLTIIGLLLSASMFAQSGSIPERPSPARLVNNMSSSGFISSGEERQLEEKLEAFANETSNQIVVVIVDDLGGMEPWAFATELGQKWGVGQKNQDNGVVVLVKPTGAEGQRYLEIVVGYGLEGAIPDLTTKQIREEMYPFFKKKQGYEGLDHGTDVLMALAKGEYNSDQYGAKHKSGPGKLKMALILLVIIVFIIISIKRGGRGGGNGMSMGTGFFLGSMMSGRGFGGGGGGSSGGFGGFGGGGFGGGGSGGSW